MGRRGSTGAISGLANFMPRAVWQLVGEHTSLQTPARRARIITLLGLLEGYSLIPALKGIMAILSSDESWLRVRPPLVALSADEFTALGKAITTFGIDTKSD